MPAARVFRTDKPPSIPPRGPSTSCHGHCGELVGVPTRFGRKQAGGTEARCQAGVGRGEGAEGPKCTWPTSAPARPIPSSGPAAASAPRLHLCFHRPITHITAKPAGPLCLGSSFSFEPLKHRTGGPGSSTSRPFFASLPPKPE